MSGFSQILKEVSDRVIVDITVLNFFDIQLHLPIQIGSETFQALNVGCDSLFAFKIKPEPFDIIIN